MNPAGHPQAVFLSYSRLDLAAARRIADALAAFDVEVWFDQDGLEGGDAWDQKIRRQIKECAMFIPVISANTQAQREGYFRLEWKLAEERTHLMAEGTSFLLPVVIDETPATGALVPESFLKTQWTRLPRGVPSTAFVERVRALLAKPQHAPTPPAAGSPELKIAGQSEKKMVGIAMAAALIIAAVGWLWLQRSGAKVSELAPATNPTLSAKSIAVLPFTNMSDDRENAFFSDGIHEDILTSLANLADLKVIARTSVMQYRDTRKTIRVIGEELGVAYVLEGSVRRVGNTVRVTGQLIDARTEAHVWADRYDQEIELKGKEIFATQSALATQIVAALHAVLTPGEKALLDRALTNNPEAYDLYLRGREELNRATNTRDRLAKSQPLLEGAVKLDPGFARAWRALATVHARAYNTLDRSAAQLAQMKACIDTAMRLAPNDPDVLLGLGTYYEVNGEPARAAEIYQRVARDHPNNTDALIFLSIVGRGEGGWKERLATLRQIRLLDPRSPREARRLYQLLGALRRYAEMEKMVREDTALAPVTIMERYEVEQLPFLARGEAAPVAAFVAKVGALRGQDPDALMVSAQWAFDTGDAARLVQLWEEAGPNWRFSPVFERLDLLAVAMALIQLNQPERAKPLLEKSRDRLKADLVVQPTNEVKQVDLALTYALLGEKVLAGEFLNRGNFDPSPGFAVSLALVHAWLGQKDQAVTLLAKILTQPGVPTFGNVNSIRHSVGWTPLRGYPAFEALLDDPKNNAPFL